MEKIKLGCAVLCEGKYDKIKLSSVIDGVILTTDGFGIFNNAEKRAMLRRLCEVRGLVILTDSDRAGGFIRSKLKGMLPPDRVRHLYIPEIRGKERRKERASQDGLLGVEGIPAPTLRKIIEDARLDESFGTAPTGAGGCERISKAELFEMGLSGGKNSAARRAALCRALSLPQSLGANALTEALYLLGVDREKAASLLAAEVKAEGEADSEKESKTDSNVKTEAQAARAYTAFFPEPARRAQALLQKNGYETYFVGGCVRDFLLSRQAKDFDLATAASSDEILRIFSSGGFRAKLIGGVCGTVSVIDTGSAGGTSGVSDTGSVSDTSGVCGTGSVSDTGGASGTGSASGSETDHLDNEKGVEITPFRAERESGYADHRHPGTVVFTKDVAEDLARRDFTVNSMAASFTDADGFVFIDLFGGRKDLENGIIRCVGRPDERFEEDALRMLRALRFAARFSFEIEEHTARAMHEKKHLLRWISGERKRGELFEILSYRCEKLLLSFSDVFEEWMGAISPAGIDDAAGNFPEKLFYLLRFRRADETERLAEALRLSSAERETLGRCKKIFDRFGTEISRSDGIDLIVEYGGFFADYLKLFRRYDAFADLYENPLLPKTVKELAVGGRELMAAGFSGASVGICLRGLLRAVLCGKTENRKDALIGYAKAQAHAVGTESEKETEKK